MQCHDTWQTAAPQPVTFLLVLSIICVHQMAGNDRMVHKAYIDLLALQALKRYREYLTPFEQAEILDFSQVGAILQCRCKV